MGEILRQPRFTVRTVANQVFVLTAVSEGWLDAVSPADARQLSWSAAEHLRSDLPDIVDALDAGRTLPDDWKERMRALLGRLMEERT